MGHIARIGEPGVVQRAREWSGEARAGDAGAAQAAPEPIHSEPSPERRLGARPLSPVEVTAALLRGRFTALVVWHLFWGPKRFYQLVRELESVPRRALAHELERLERAGMVERHLHRPGQTRVEFRLTARGQGLRIVVGAMYEWGLLARLGEEPRARSHFAAEGAH